MNNQNNSVIAMAQTAIFIKKIRKKNCKENFSIEKKKKKKVLLNSKKLKPSMNTPIIENKKNELKLKLPVPINNFGVSCKGSKNSKIRKSQRKQSLLKRKSLEQLLPNQMDQIDQSPGKNLRHRKFDYEERKFRSGVRLEQPSSALEILREKAGIKSKMTLSSKKIKSIFSFESINSFDIERKMSIFNHNEIILEEGELSQSKLSFSNFSSFSKDCPEGELNFSSNTSSSSSSSSSSSLGSDSIVRKKKEVISYKNRKVLNKKKRSVEHLEEKREKLGSLDDLHMGEFVIDCNPSSNPPLEHPNRSINRKNTKTLFVRTDTLAHGLRSGNVEVKFDHGGLKNKKSDMRAKSKNFDFYSKSAQRQISFKKKRELLDPELVLQSGPSINKISQGSLQSLVPPKQAKIMFTYEELGILAFVCSLLSISKSKIYKENLFLKKMFSMFALLRSANLILIIQARQWIENDRSYGLLVLGLSLAWIYYSQFRCGWAFKSDALRAFDLFIWFGIGFMAAMRTIEALFEQSMPSDVINEKRKALLLMNLVLKLVGMVVYLREVSKRFGMRWRLVKEIERREKPITLKKVEIS